VSLATSYTLGRAKNYSTGDGNGGIQTPADIERSWGRRGEDRLHDFVAAWTYDVPRPPVPNRLVRTLLADWHLSGVWVAQSGLPVDFAASNASLRAPGNRQRPNVSRTPEILGLIGPGNPWFDTAVFSVPSVGTWGNVSRNDLLDGPGYQNVDLAIVKAFTMPKARGEFRIDAFNVFNMPHFNNPDGTLGNATFGQVTSVLPGSERLVRFGARLSF
jgi:hypothetical protein